MPTPEPEPEPELEPEPTEEPITYRVTVNYWFDEVGGTPAAKSFTNVYQPGDSYKVISQKIPGYDVDKTEVAGTVGEEDLVFDVIYTAKEYSLTIKYVYLLDGTEAAPTHTDSLKAGEVYTVTSPEVDGAYASVETVFGVMLPTDTVRTVYYITLPKGRTYPDLFIIEDYETPLGIGNVNLNAGECFE